MDKFVSGNFFVYVRFFEIKNIYSHTHSAYAGRKVKTNFSPGRFPETRLHFFFFFFSLTGRLDLKNSTETLH